MLLKLTDSDFERLTTYIRNNYGINLTKKRTLIEGRLGNMLAERGYADYTSYIDAVFKDATGAEITGLINRLTTNHTYFMREPEHFEYFKTVILPYLESTVRDHDIRIWSAGCSSGEEPYTIAMIMDEYFGSRKSQWDCKILATDISMKVLTRAKEGVYHTDGLSDIPPEWKARYFRPHGADAHGAEALEIVPAIRNEVVFREFNLMDPIVYKRPFDLIFCRNVMIYFEGPTKNALVSRFYDVTKPGGWLFIGHAESIPRDATRYQYVKPAVYRR